MNRPTAYDKRKVASQELFSYEFTNVPECLVNKEGKPYHGTKSDLLKTIVPRVKQDTLLWSTAFNVLVFEYRSICDKQRASSSKQPYRGHIIC